MSGTQQSDPFNIYEYTIPDTSVQITVTKPDLINGLITAQDNSVKAFFGEATVTASFGAVAKLGIASGVAFDVRVEVLGSAMLSGSHLP